MHELQTHFVFEREPFKKIFSDIGKGTKLQNKDYKLKNWAILRLFFFNLHRLLESNLKQRLLLPRHRRCAQFVREVPVSRKSGIFLHIWSTESSRHDEASYARTC